MINATNKKRSLLFLFVLALLITSYGKYLFLPFYPELVESIYGSFPAWFPWFAVLAIIWGIATLWLLWQKKRWGVYLFALSALIGLIIDFTVFDLALWAHIAYFISVAFITAVLYSEWKDFQ